MPQKSREQVPDVVSKAIKDPDKVYEQPDDVVRDLRLSCEDKAKILKSWEEDQLALMRAEGENMPPQRAVTSPVTTFEKVKQAEKALENCDAGVEKPGTKNPDA